MMTRQVSRLPMGDAIDVSTVASLPAPGLPECSVLRRICERVHFSP